MSDFRKCLLVLCLSVDEYGSEQPAFLLFCGALVFDLYAVAVINHESSFEGFLHAVVCFRAFEDVVTIAVDSAPSCFHREAEAVPALKLVGVGAEAEHEVGGGKTLLFELVVDSSLLFKRD